jgi:XTP/dITP diphosphohydrolase
MKLLIATTNQGKLAQYKKVLGDLHIELVSTSDLNLPSVDETGKTLEENALLKARTYFTQSGLSVISDDGGFEIDALGGEPGVYSRRWKTGDENVTDQELIDFTMEKMKDVPEDKRQARFRMVMVFIDANGKEHMVETKTEGVVPLQASSTIVKNLPYDSTLYIERFKKIRSELTDKENSQINQRLLALEELKPTIKEAFGL